MEGYRNNQSHILFTHKPARPRAAQPRAGRPRAGAPSADRPFREPTAGKTSQIYTPGRSSQGRQCNHKTTPHIEPAQTISIRSRVDL